MTLKQSMLGRTESDVSDDERAMLDIMGRAREGDADFSEDELMALYEQKRSTVGEFLTGDD